METFESIQPLRDRLALARRAGQSIGFFPTLGAMHAGHTALIDRARAQCDLVVVSIFLNPAQFGPGEDLDRYPRMPEADRQACVDHGVDVVFMPPAQEMYPQPPMTEVNVPSLGRGLCGGRRPGHFAGVCLVVAKLLHIVAPDRAYFGMKDFQQLRIIEQMVADLDMLVDIVRCPTVREADGLAMSSRNAYLGPDQRRQAPALHRALQAARRRVLDEAPPAADLARQIRSHLADQAPLGEVDYVEIVDPRTLAPVETTGEDVLIALAVRFAGARLIDNVLVEHQNGA